MDIVAFYNDADTYCFDCAIKRYGSDAVYDGGYDHEGNPLNPVFDDSPDLHGQYCMGECYQLLQEGKHTVEDNQLCDCGECYKPCPYEGCATAYDYYNQYGTLPDLTAYGQAIDDDEDNDTRIEAIEKLLHEDRLPFKQWLRLRDEERVKLEALRVEVQRSIDWDAVDSTLYSTVERVEAIDRLLNDTTTTIIERAELLDLYTQLTSS